MKYFKKMGLRMLRYTELTLEKSDMSGEGQDFEIYQAKT